MIRSMPAKLRVFWHLMWSTMLVIALLIMGYSTFNLTSHRAFAQTNPIVQENQNPGSTSWQIDYNIGTVSNDISQQIKGYASATSVDQGQSINFHITVSPAQSYTIDIYRMGWYNGAGGRLMQTVGSLSGTSQPACPQDPTTGLTQCNWAVAHTLTVPTTWTTGIYLAKLTNSQGFQSYITFVVRDDDRVADFLYQQAVTTYQAYNNYPSNGSTGKSLYNHNSFGPNTIAGNPRAVKVSFDRPYGGGGGYDGGGQFAEDQWWERYFVSWAEQMGYDISYTTDVDTHVNGARLLNFKGFLSVGHDEYWSKQMYDAVEAARNSGVNLAFFGGNAVYYQIRFEPSATGTPNRVMVNYRTPSLDPVTDPALKTTFWRSVNRAEQQLIGVQYVTDGSFFNTLPYIITNSAHWVWANTGFVNGSIVPGLLGYEVDKLFTEYPAPNSVSYTVLASSTYTSTNYFPNVVTPSQSSIYQAPSGSWVFGAGTIAWSWGLSRPSFINAGIQQATKNILDHFLLPVVPPTPTPTPPPNCAGLQREAETGTLTGAFVIGNDAAASGGQFVQAPTGTGDQPAGPNQAHKASYCFTVTSAGTYRIKGKVYGADTLSDSFFVQVDGAPTNGYLWDVFPNTSYAMDYVSNRSVADPVELQLTAGQHTVTVFVREAGTRLDTIELELVNSGPGPNPTCAGLVQEAETGALSGTFVVGNDTAASGGQYVHTPNGSGDQWNGPNATRKASYCFNVTTAGTYRIKTVVYGADTASDSFYVQMDGAPVTGYLWDILANATYTTDYVSDRGVADPVEIQLPTGLHTATVFVREDGTRLDKIELQLISSGPGPDPICAGLVQEAETGALSGSFVVGNDVAASGGQYVTTPETAGDVWNGPNAQQKVAYCFNVAAAGTYRIRSKVYGADDLSDSFYVQVDGAPAAGMTWDTLPNTSYLSDYVNNRNVADPVQVVLSSGPHTVTVYLREDAARLDTIELEPVILAASLQADPSETEGFSAGAAVAQGVAGYIRPTLSKQSNEMDFSNIYLTLKDAQTMGEHYSQRIQADRIGHYRFDGMAPGKYVLSLELPAGLSTSTNQVEISATTARILDVSFDIVDTEEGNQPVQRLFLPLVNR